MTSSIVGREKHAPPPNPRHPGAGLENARHMARLGLPVSLKTIFPQPRWLVLSFCRRERNQRQLEAESGMKERQQLPQATRDMQAEVDAIFGTMTTIKRDDEATTKRNDRMAAARRDGDETLAEKNDTMETVRCDEEKTETRTGRGREVPLTLGKEISRDRMMIGVGRNVSTTERATTFARNTRNRSTWPSTLPSLARSGEGTQQDLPSCQDGRGGLNGT